MKILDTIGQISDYPLEQRYAILRRMSEELRRLIEAAGGVYTKAALAKKLGISRQRMDELASHPDFPKPIFTQGRAAWYAFYEVQAFRDIVRKPGRPRKDP